MSMSENGSVSIFMDENDETAADVIFGNIPPVLLSSLRRTMMTDVETWAVDQVHLINYTGDEPWSHVVHRLHLLVIDNNLMNSIETETTGQYSLDVNICNENQDSRILVSVSSSQLSNTHPIGVVLDNGITICTLRPNQRLKAKLFLKRACGIEQEKWNPSVAVSLKPSISISFDKSLLLRNGNIVASIAVESLVKTCPTGVFSAGVDIEDSPVLINTSRCTLCRKCEREWKKAIDLKIRIEEEEMHMHVETNGSMTPTDLLVKSFRKLSQRCSEIEF